MVSNSQRCLQKKKKERHLFPDHPIIPRRSVEEFLLLRPSDHEATNLCTERHQRRHCIDKKPTMADRNKKPGKNSCQRGRKKRIPTPDWVKGANGLPSPFLRAGFDIGVDLSVPRQRSPASPTASNAPGQAAATTSARDPVPSLRPPPPLRPSQPAAAVLPRRPRAVSVARPRRLPPHARLLSLPRSPRPALVAKSLRPSVLTRTPSLITATTRVRNSIPPASSPWELSTSVYQC